MNALEKGTLKRDTLKPASLSSSQAALGWALAGLAVLCFVLFFYRLGSYPLFDVDEPRYAETAREMLESGNWITPTFNYELRLVKPVFFYWLVAISYQIFGLSEFAARFFSAISATSMVLLTFWLGQRFVSLRFGLFSAIILATSIQMIGLARMAITDMTLAALLTATTASLFLVERHSTRWWLAAGFFSGLAILTKGPIGMVMPGAILVLYSLLSGSFRRCFLTGYFPAAIILSLAVALPWYWLAYLQNGDVFLQELYHNNFSRFTGNVAYHPEPWWYYLPVVTVGFLPWSIFLPVALIHWGRLFKHHRRQLADSGHEYRLLLFSAIWATFVFLFFSVANTKLLTYVLPMFPAMAFLMAATFLAMPQHPKLGRSLAVSAALLLGVLMIAAPIFIFEPGLFLPKIARHIQQFTDNPLSMAAVVTLLLGTLLMTVFLFQKQAEKALLSQGFAFGMIAIFALHSVVPAVNQVTQGAMLAFVQQAGSHPLAIYEITRPSLTYYARRKIPHVARRETNKLESMLQATRPVRPERSAVSLPRTKISGMESSAGLLYIITKNSLLDDLKTAIPPNSDLELVDQRQVYSLLILSDRASHEKTLHKQPGRNP